VSGFKVCLRVSVFDAKDKLVDEELLVARLLSSLADLIQASM